MASKTKQKKYLEDKEPVIGIESRLELDSIMLKKNRWFCKMVIRTVLPRSYHRYKMLMIVDERPFEERIAELREQHETSLLSKIPKEARKLNKTIGEIQFELDTLKKECEKIEFSTMVEALKYRNGETLLQIGLPDDVVEPLNRQKLRLSHYKIILTPQMADPEIIIPVLKD